MARIAWVEDSEAQGLLSEIYEQARSTRDGRMPDIYRTMSLRPDFLRGIFHAAENLHFHDGALTRAQHEMIASYVAALNKCHY